jgi:hypothetical protein
MRRIRNHLPIRAHVLGLEQRGCTVNGEEAVDDGVRAGWRGLAETEAPACCASPADFGEGLAVVY